jgi:hypothetical protein
MTKTKLRNVVAALSPERNLSGAIYGTITAGALLAAESSYRQTLAQATSALGMTLVLYWLAHTYASLLDRRLRTTTRWTPRDFVKGLVHEWPIVQGAFIPMVVLVVAAAAGASVRTAEYLALASSAALLVILEIVAGRRATLRAAEAVANVAVGILLALGLIAVKALLK